MFSLYIIVMPPVCPPCEKNGSQNHSRCWKEFKYAEDAGKPNNVPELEEFSEEQQAVELLRTNKRLMNNYHKTEKPSWII